MQWASLRRFCTVSITKKFYHSDHYTHVLEMRWFNISWRIISTEVSIPPSYALQWPGLNCVCAVDNDIQPENCFTYKFSQIYNDFTIIIQMMQIHFDFIQIVTNLSPQYFSQAMAAVLSWHVRNFAVARNWITDETYFHQFWIVNELSGVKWVPQTFVWYETGHWFVTYSFGMDWLVSTQVYAIYERRIILRS